MIKVFHNNNFLSERFSSRENLDISDMKLFDLVAIIATDDLDEAYLLTNSIDISWFKINSSKFSFSKPARSTSVGDVLAINEKEYFRVEMIGFKKIEVLF